MRLEPAVAIAHPGTECQHTPVGHLPRLFGSLNERGKFVRPSIICFGPKPAHIIAVLFALWSAPAIAEEVVVICTLNQKRDTSSLDHPKTTNEEFVLKFDDAQKRVTYLAGQAVRVRDSSEFRDRFDNEIIFNGDSLMIDDGFTRYSGSISRLTGRIKLMRTSLRKDGTIDRRPGYGDGQHEMYGTCVAGPRKF